jgi:hypothetical protein
VDDVEVLVEEGGEGGAFEAGAAGELSQEWREGTGGGAQRMDADAGMERDGGRLDGSAEQVEGVDAMGDVDLMAGGGQEVGEVGNEHGIAAEMRRREERGQEAKAHGSVGG